MKIIEQTSLNSGTKVKYSIEFEMDSTLFQLYEKLLNLDRSKTTERRTYDYISEYLGGLIMSEYMEAHHPEEHKIIFPTYDIHR